MSRIVCGWCEMDECRCHEIESSELTFEDIISIAEETELEREKEFRLFQSAIDDEITIDDLEQLVAFVIAQEREACAKICDQYKFTPAADAIRARGSMEPDTNLGEQ